MGLRNPNDMQKQSVWQSYSHVYDLMAEVPFVKDLRRRHVEALHGSSLVLDGGCGVGLIAAELARCMQRRVVGIDLNRAMLDRAANRLKHFSNVRLFNSDVHSLPFKDTSFDAYISNNVLYCVKDPTQALSEITRVIRPGGILSMASPRPSIQVDALIEGFLLYVTSTGKEVPKEHLELFITANKVLEGELRNVYEPDDISRLLRARGCWRILEEDTTYLNQDFFVVAQRL